MTVIGVVADVRNSDIDQPPLSHVYFPYTLEPASAMAVFVRTEGDPLLMAPDLRQAVWRVDAEQPVGAWGFAMLIADQLYGVSATDLATWLGSVSLLLLVVVAASWLPARAAVRLSPLTAIRRE